MGWMNPGVPPKLKPPLTMMMMMMMMMVVVVMRMALVPAHRCKASQGVAIVRKIGYFFLHRTRIANDRNYFIQDT